MSPAPAWISEIDSQAGGLPVVLVEGVDDIALYAHFFDQHAPGWDRRFIIKAAGGKRPLWAALTSHRPGWIGIVDHDEWDSDRIAEAVAMSQRLNALPRFSIESYFCHPDDLWAAIPPVRRAQLPDRRLFDQPIYDQLTAWVRHGALWRVLRSLYRQTDFPEELERGPVPVDDDLSHDARVQQILADWHQNLVPSRMMAAYHAELQSARQRPADDQIRTYVHGKKFYRQVVVPVLNNLYRSMGGSGDGWLEAFRNAGIQPPLDLRQLLDWVLSLLPPPPSTT